LTLTGLSGGVAYRFSVAAHNAIGVGTRSAEISAAPNGAPGAPRNVTATPGTLKVTISWTAPSDDGGSPITGYKVYRQLAGGSELLTTVGASTLSYADTTGTAGTTYTYYVVAVNAVGSGSASTSVSAAPQSNTSSDNTMLYVGIAVAVIAIIAIAALLMRKKK
jgi:fibronectin type 3 domain-containing protein